MHLEYWIQSSPIRTRAIPLWLAPARKMKLGIKRACDIFLSGMLLIFLSPLFLITALLIKVTSPGPIFFKKEMLGINLTPFTMYKFRTMIQGAEKLEAELMSKNKGRFLKVQDDSRITPVGKFLRKFSIDELPQLFNVLKGNMSLVGPRPLFGLELQQFEEWKYLKRFRMRPGLTCIWQVSGRSKTSDNDRIRYDIEYIDKWSLSLDAKLLVNTIPVVLTGDGAM